MFNPNELTPLVRTSARGANDPDLKLVVKTKKFNFSKVAFRTLGLDNDNGVVVHADKASGNAYIQVVPEAEAHFMKQMGTRGKGQGFTHGDLYGFIQGTALKGEKGFKLERQGDTDFYLIAKWEDESGVVESFDTDETPATSNVSVGEDGAIEDGDNASEPEEETAEGTTDDDDFFTS